MLGFQVPNAVIEDNTSLCLGRDLICDGESIIVVDFDSIYIYSFGLKQIERDEIGRLRCVYIDKNYNVRFSICSNENRGDERERWILHNFRSRGLFIAFIFSLSPASYSRLALSLELPAAAALRIVAIYTP